MDKLETGEPLAPAGICKFLKDWQICHIENPDRNGYSPYVTARM